MKKIQDALKKWGDIISEKNKILEKSKKSIPYSQEDEEKISDLDKEAKAAEKELIDALRGKYQELSDKSGQIPGYSRSDFEKDLKTSYQKVKEKLQNYAGKHSNITFNSILQQLLEEYEKDPSRNVEEMLAEKLKELGASEECLAEVQESSETFDKFAEKSASLEEARKEGKSRAKWLMEQVDSSLDGLAEDTKVTVLNAVGETVEKKTNEMFNQ